MYINPSFEMIVFYHQSRNALKNRWTILSWIDDQIELYGLDIDTMLN